MASGIISSEKLKKMTSKNTTQERSIANLIEQYAPSNNNQYIHTNFSTQYFLADNCFSIFVLLIGLLCFVLLAHSYSKALHEANLENKANVKFLEDIETLQRLREEDKDSEISIQDYHKYVEGFSELEKKATSAKISHVAIRALEITINDSKIAKFVRERSDRIDTMMSFIFSQIIVVGPLIALFIVCSFLMATRIIVQIMRAYQTQKNARILGTTIADGMRTSRK